MALKNFFNSADSLPGTSHLSGDINRRIEWRNVWGTSIWVFFFFLSWCCVTPNVNNNQHNLFGGKFAKCILPQVTIIFNLTLTSPPPLYQEKKKSEGKVSSSGINAKEQSQIFLCFFFPRVGGFKIILQNNFFFFFFALYFMKT